MGLDMVYAAGGREHPVRIADAEWAALDALGKVNPAAVRVLFDVTTLGDAIEVGAEEVVRAAEALAALLRERPEPAPGTYQMRAERDITGGPGNWEGGGVSGPRLPGDREHFPALWLGPERCELVKMRVGADGRGEEVGREDLRGRDHLDTETLGRVEFRRKAMGAGLRKKLDELMALVRRAGKERVSKMMC